MEVAKGAFLFQVVNRCSLGFRGYLLRVRVQGVGCRVSEHFRRKVAPGQDDAFGQIWRVPGVVPFGHHAKTLRGVRGKVSVVIFRRCASCPSER